MWSIFCSLFLCLIYIYSVSRASLRSSAVCVCVCILSAALGMCLCCLFTKQHTTPPHQIGTCTEHKIKLNSYLPTVRFRRPSLLEYVGTSPILVGNFLDVTAGTKYLGGLEEDSRRSNCDLLFTSTSCPS